MLAASDPNMMMMLDPSITAALWQAGSYGANSGGGGGAVSAGRSTTYLPWLLGAGALAYLILFRRKKG
jgi:hypothetical protein